ncbi:MAG: sigma-70 family RNA polymerase sigma factor [Anaerolineae bacterium]|nr:sigma-70 family RNA polymerase sigma factor [Anaerolineae bacterium]MCI0609896.1 sigma-70 family RNA polymerase sigma factor [Anaerolineae bacterium]
MKKTIPDDTQLIRRIAQAQSDALNELYDRYNRRVFSVAAAIVGDLSVAEEITLDVFVQVWKHAGTYQPDRAKVSTWLIAITRHHAIDILRWQKSRPDTNSLNLDGMSLQDGPAHSPEENMELTMQREQVREALSQLPEEQREALVLAYFKGYTQSQISEELGQPLGTIKTRIRLAMQKLRKLLVED